MSDVRDLLNDLKSDLNNRFDRLEGSMRETYVSKIEHAEVRTAHALRLDAAEDRIKTTAAGIWTAITGIAVAAAGAVVAWILKGGAH